MNRDGFVKVIKKTRKMMATGAAADCPCPKVKCEWHGRGRSGRRVNHCVLPNAANLGKSPWPGVQDIAGAADERPVHPLRLAIKPTRYAHRDYK